MNVLGVEKYNTFNDILGSQRRSQLKEKLVNAFEGYEPLTKTQQITYKLNLSHNDEEIPQEMYKYIKYVCVLHSIV